MTHRRPYKVRVDSIRHKVKAWLDANPDEFLTYEDVGVKFELNQRQVRRLAYSLKADGSARTAHVLYAAKDGA